MNYIGFVLLAWLIAVAVSCATSDWCEFKEEDDDDSDDAYNGENGI